MYINIFKHAYIILNRVFQYAITLFNILSVIIKVTLHNCVVLVLMQILMLSHLNLSMEYHDKGKPWQSKIHTYIHVWNVEYIFRVLQTQLYRVIRRLVFLITRIFRPINIDRLKNELNVVWQRILYAVHLQQ